MNQNQMNMGSNIYTQKQGFQLEIPQKDKKIFIAFIVCLVTLAIGCFLPFMIQNSTGISMNYISYDGDIKDGVYILIMGIAALGAAFKGKYIVTLVFQLISTAIFAIDTFDMMDRMSEVNKYASILGGDYKIKFGIGFYLVLVGLIGSVVTAFLLWKANKEVVQTPIANQGMQNINQPVVPQTPIQPQPVVQNHCPYCGTPRNNNSAYCGNCGAKFN